MMPEMIKKVQSIISTNRKYAYLSVLIAFSATTLIFISFFQRNFFSKTYMVYSLIVFLSIFILSFFFIHLLKEQIIPSGTRKYYIASFVVSVGIGMMLLLNFFPIPFYQFVPDRIVEIHFQAQESNNSLPPVTFLYLRNALGYIPYSELDLIGPWLRDEDYIQLDSQTDAAMIWEGKTDGLLEIGFLPMRDPYEVQVIIDGKQHLFNLQGNPQDDLVVFKVEREAPAVSKLPFIVTFLIVFPFILLVSEMLLASLHIKKIKELKVRYRSNLYGLPLLITSVFTLFTFWPGMMTNDSITQWREIVNGSYTNLNPLFHTMLSAALVNIWNSPAVIATFQILVFFVLVSYGMSMLSKMGIPKFILWVLAIILAIWPFNPLMASILWKDILYSFSLLGLFLILMQIILSEGKWLEKPGHWITLGILGFLLPSFRHNGLPVAFLTLGCIPIFFKQFRKQQLMAFALALFIWSGFNGFIKPMVIKEDGNINSLNLTLLHHISAHLDAGTPMSEDQMNYLNAVLPLGEWDYDCCYMGNIYSNPDFDQSGYMQNTILNRDIAFSLFRKNPMVDIRDQLCASEMTWRFINNQCTYKSLHPFQSYSPIIKGWIPWNDMGLSEASLLPGMIPFYTKILERIQAFSGSLNPLFRPAFYFYLSIFSVAVVCLRLRNLKVLIMLIPILAQTGTLALVNFAPAFRYQYGICLIGLFSLGIIWLQKGHVDAE